MMTISRVPFRHQPGERFQTRLSRAELRLRVLDAFDWCLPRVDGERPRDCLRSEELKPYLFNDSRYDTVNDLVWARHCRLANAGVADCFPFAIGDTEAEHTTRRSVPPLEAGCRLLVWQRDLTVDDGAGELCTNGYLDPSDMPPWDSWIAYVREEDDPVASSGYLVSLVPAPFVPSVQKAIEFNAYDALFWLAERNLLLGSVLREEGLLV